MNTSLDQAVEAVCNSRNSLQAAIEFYEEWQRELFPAVGSFEEIVALRSVAHKAEAPTNLPSGCSYVCWNPDERLSRSHTVRSQLGGIPWRPVGEPWPSSEGQSLTFVCQLVLNEAGEEFDGLIVLVFAECCDRAEFQRKHYGVNVNAEFVSLGLEPYIEVWRIDDIEAWSKTDELQTVFDTAWYGEHVASKEWPLTDEAETSEAVELWNLPVTKVCPDYWAANATRWSVEEKQDFAPNRPIAQVSPFDSRRSSHPLLAPIRSVLSTKGAFVPQTGMSKDSAFAFGDGFTVVIYVDIHGRLRCTHVP